MNTDETIEAYENRLRNTVNDMYARLCDPETTNREYGPLHARFMEAYAELIERFGKETSDEDEWAKFATAVESEATQ